tara:strand:- start:334 stop:798 length:465 start_codon:yes stop_codon:yes gene_type:complete
MTTELVKSIDTIKKKIITLEKNLEDKIEENKSILKKNEELQDELANLNKVSMVKVLSKQIDEKNSRIEILEKQIASLRNKKQTKLLDNESDNESISEAEPDLPSIEEGYELIIHDDIRLLKNIETRKLYYIGMNGSKGKYAGKQSKKGKIKLRD